MKQLTYALESKKDVDKLFDDIRSVPDIRTASCVYAQIYVYAKGVPWFDDFLDALKDVLPGVIIAGITAHEQIASGQRVIVPLALSLMVFERSTVELKEYDMDEVTEETAALDLARYINEKKDVKAVQFFMDAVSISAQDFFDSFDLYDEGVSFFGCGSGAGLGSVYGFSITQ